MVQKKFRFKKTTKIKFKGEIRLAYKDDRTLPMIFWPSKLTGSNQWCEN